ncbi:MULTISPECIES: tryptophan 2,3-dioxygenase family protein [unclassified Kitasatospora]|uniref:tryptophan 2,3-dioxygenase family protein n=1 Tax=unclassified Kitasatospora TaxID=2633591 RepID=UPI0006714657|nr:tryptophan 2,3-dioxygenase family protein [Kitasatospora sp. MY 5-36]
MTEAVTETITDLTYSTYLQMDTLLSLQQTRFPESTDRSVALAEHFFIVAHQSCELWLKQIVADLRLARDLLNAPGDPAGGAEDGVELLQRAAELLRVLHEQVIVLERLPLRHFVRFRPYLGTASGAQSQQFRVLGRLLEDGTETSELYRAFLADADRQGLSAADVCRLGVACGGPHRVAEALLDVGNGYWRWKVAHLGLVTKMVGGQQGTGGTSGEDYLLRRITLPFRDLRQLRGNPHTEVLATSPV